MALCGSTQCNCAIQGSDNLSVTGAGDASSPWTIDVATDPPNLAKGIVGSATATPDTTGITAITDVTAATVTWTAVAARKYLILYTAVMWSTVANDTGRVSVTDGSNNVMHSVNAYDMGTASTTSQSVSGSYIETGLSGSTTRKLRAQRTGGTGTLTVSGNGVLSATIMVIDIGT